MQIHYAAALIVLVSFTGPARLATAAAADPLARYSGSGGSTLTYSDPNIHRSFCLKYAAGAMSGSVQRVGSGTCGPDSFLFVLDPKTKALQLKSPSGTLSGACLTDFGSFASGKNTPGTLVITICSRTIGPSQQWTMTPTRNLRAKSGLCIGLDTKGNFATVKCGDKAELRF